jgi:hypothetical protein
MSVTAVYTTMDEGYLNVSHGISYAGRIGCYNNLLTILIAWLTNSAIWVEMDPDKKKHRFRYMDKDDYAAFLRRNVDGSITESDLEKYTHFKQLALKCPNVSKPMRHFISRAKSERLFIKMVHAMTANQFEKAKNYAAKGAKLDDKFWTRDHYGLAFFSVIERLPKEETKFRNTLYTPLLYAADKKNSDFCKFILALGAQDNVVGRSYILSRTKKAANEQFPLYIGDRNGAEEIPQIPQFNNINTPIEDLEYSSHTQSLNHNRSTAGPEIVKD